MRYFDHKTIWITGASSGIGKALSLFLSQYDCSLILSSRRAELLEEVKSNCKDPSRVCVLPFDLKETNLMSQKVQEAILAFGNIDILVNNGGISQRSALLETTLEVDRKLMEVDYLGTVALSKALLPHFIDRQRGQFVVVTSLMGKFSSPFRSAYCGAKHALHGFFDALRLEHEKDGVSVTFICPGFVNTNVARNALTGDGSPQGYQDEKTQNGMPADVFAIKMARAIRKRKFEAYIGGIERIGVLVKNLSPRLIHWMVKNKRVR
jgi:short-subunit dehydrogenase